MSLVTIRRRQQTAPWDRAEPLLCTLLTRAASRNTAHGVVVVGITGPVGSGKTTLATRLGGVRLSTDHYLPDYETLPEHERDEPRHADLPALAAHLAALKTGRSVEMPVWCFHAHRRVGTVPVQPGPLVVCEGIFALHPAVRAWMDVAVFVDAPADVRWARWKRLEAAGERGWGIERAKQYLTTVADPTFARYAEDYRASADVVVLNDQEKGSRA